MRFTIFVSTTEITERITIQIYEPYSAIQIDFWLNNWYVKYMTNWEASQSKLLKRKMQMKDNVFIKNAIFTTWIESVSDFTKYTLLLKKIKALVSFSIRKTLLESVYSLYTNDYFFPATVHKRVLNELFFRNILFKYKKYIIVSQIKYIKYVYKLHWFRFNFIHYGISK